MSIETHRELDSTQRYCIDKANSVKGIKVVIAEQQTQGVGRKGGVWISCKECLTFSVCIENVFFEDSALLAMNCIKKALERNEVHGLTIKWPNDLCITKDGEKNKVCGVIVNVVNTESGIVSIIGIGLNISGNIPYFTLADAGYILDKEKVFSDILFFIEHDFILGSRKNNWNMYFSEKYVLLNEKKYEIISVCNNLVIQKDQEILTISPADYSYCAHTNMLTQKRTHKNT